MPKFFSVRRAGPGIGDGMYHAADGLFSLPGYPVDECRHPPPYRDTALNWDNIGYILGVPHHQCYFSFGSIEQLKT